MKGATTYSEFVKEVYDYYSGILSDEEKILTNSIAYKSCELDIIKLECKPDSGFSDLLYTVVSIGKYKADFSVSMCMREDYEEFGSEYTSEVANAVGRIVINSLNNPEK